MDREYAREMRIREEEKVHGMSARDRLEYLEQKEPGAKEEVLLEARRRSDEQEWERTFWGGDFEPWQEAYSPEDDEWQEWMSGGEVEGISSSYVEMNDGQIEPFGSDEMVFVGEDEDGKTIGALVNFDGGQVQGLGSLSDRALAIVDDGSEESLAIVEWDGSNHRMTSYDEYYEAQVGEIASEKLACILMSEEQDES